MSRRTDARANREAILRAADAAYATSDAPVPLDEIARRTGLGRATVYRHFPDRHALAMAVAAENLNLLRRAATGADGEQLPFRDLLHVVLSTQATMQPLADLLREIPSSEQRQVAGNLVGILTPALRRAQSEGRLRADIEPTDIVLVLLMLNAAADTDAESFGRDRSAAVARLVAVLVDGLFAPDPSPATIRPH